MIPKLGTAVPEGPQTAAEFKAWLIHTDGIQFKDKDKGCISNVEFYLSDVGEVVHDPSITFDKQVLR